MASISDLERQLTEARAANRYHDRRLEEMERLIQGLAERAASAAPEEAERRLGALEERVEVNTARIEALEDRALGDVAPTGNGSLDLPSGFGPGSSDSIEGVTGAVSRDSCLAIRGEGR